MSRWCHGSVGELENLAFRKTKKLCTLTSHLHFIQMSQKWLHWGVLLANQKNVAVVPWDFIWFPRLEEHASDVFCSYVRSHCFAMSSTSKYISNYYFIFSEHINCLEFRETFHPAEQHLQTPGFVMICSQCASKWLVQQDIIESTILDSKAAVWALRGCCRGCHHDRAHWDRPHLRHTHTQTYAPCTPIAPVDTVSVAFYTV